MTCANCKTDFTPPPFTGWVDAKTGEPVAPIRTGEYGKCPQVPLGHGA